jgi:hypothetical protein
LVENKMAESIKSRLMAAAEKWHEAEFEALCDEIELQTNCLSI